MKERSLTSRIIDEWGDRESYFVTKDEFLSLMTETGARVVELNKRNNDGTLFHSLILGGKRFQTSTIENDEIT